MNAQSNGQGRNAPCPCGSGKKFKHCCLNGMPAVAPGGPPSPPDFSSTLAAARVRAAACDFASAEMLYRQALLVKRNDSSLLAELGQCLCWLRRRREGLSYLNQAAQCLLRKTKPGDPIRPLMDLALQLQHWGESEFSLALAKRAVAMSPKAGAAHHALAMCLMRLNRNEEALSSSNRALALLPQDDNVNILNAMIQGLLGETSAARSRLECITDQNRNAVTTISALFELGNILDASGDYDAAFNALTRAHRLQRAMPASPPAAAGAPLLAHIDANKAGFDAEWLQERRRSFRPDGLPTPVFLLGFLRSGTTLLEQALAAHPNVMSSDESVILFEVTEELARITPGSTTVAEKLRKLQPDGAAHLRRFFWRRVEEEHGARALKNTFVEKSALNSIELGLINVLFPDAKVIFALRDPRDVCLSCYMQSFVLSPSVIANLDSWEAIARFYAAVMSLWLEIRDKLTVAYLELRYEDVVADFDGSCRRLLDLLELPWDPAVARFHEKARGKFISTPSFAAVSQPLYQGAVARWQRYEKHFAPILPDLDRFIRAFGYT